MKFVYWLLSVHHILFVTKKSFLLKTRIHSALSWNILIMVIYFKKLPTIKKKIKLLKKKIFGIFSSKLWRAWKPYMTKRSSIVMSKVPMCSYIGMDQWNWVTWMCQKWLRRVYCTHKLGRLIMLVQKFGKINLMIVNRIFGLWVVFYMKFVLWSLLLELMIWKVCIRKWREGCILKFLRILARIWAMLLELCCKCNPI